MKRVEETVGRADALIGIGSARYAQASSASDLTVLGSTSEQF